MIIDSFLVGISSAVIASSITLISSMILKRYTMGKNRDDFLYRLMRKAEKERKYDEALVYSSIELQEMLRNKYSNSKNKNIEFKEILRIVEKDKIFDKDEKKQLVSILAMEKQIVNKRKLGNYSKIQEAYEDSKVMLEKVNKLENKHLTTAST